MPVSTRKYLLALREADQHALQIKEAADKEALSLARDAQRYRDEQANNLRTQIEHERGSYATKIDIQALADKFEAAQKPVIEFIAAQTGRTDSKSDTRLNATAVMQLIGLAFVAVSLYLALKN
jgi:hypothetical protein